MSPAALIIAILALVVATSMTSAYAASKITSNQIAKNAVTKSKIKNGAVTAKKLKKKAVKTKSLKKGAVTKGKIKKGAVTKGKIKNGAITAKKIAPATLEDLQGAQGPQGDQGDRGPAGFGFPGPKGDPGISGYEVKGYLVYATSAWKSVTMGCSTPDGVVLGMGYEADTPPVFRKSVPEPDGKHWKVVLKSAGATTTQVTLRVTCAEIADS